MYIRSYFLFSEREKTATMFLPCFIPWLPSARRKKTKWNMPRKRNLSPKKLDDIEFVKFKRVGQDIVKGERRHSVSKQGSGLNTKPLDQNSFAEKLKSVPRGQHGYIHVKMLPKWNQL